jgi:hypothetical protein
MSELHSLWKLVKETRTSTCTRIIVVEIGLDRIAVNVNEHLTNWVSSFPNTSQKVSSRRGHSLEDAEAYASRLFEASLQDGFVRVL